MSKTQNIDKIIDRIRKGLDVIKKAQTRGQETKQWEDHLLTLIRGLAGTRKVKIKLGRFGFCTCHLGGGLCTGCWRIKNACVCRELEVHPDETINDQFAKSMH